MKIRVLGCSGSIARHCRTTSFLLDDDVLIDAGTGVGDLTLDALARIDHILLSHAHLDHVLGVPLLADSVLRRRRGRPPIAVHALADTLDVLRRHLFNDQLWPDFTRLPSADAPVLSLAPFAQGEVLQLGARRIEVLSARHSVPAVGFAVHAAAGAWVFTGDTGPNPALWQRLQQFPVAHLVIENAFSQADADLALRSGHHSPATLAAELQQAPQGATLHVTHVKPGEAQAVAADIARCCPGHAVSLLEVGQRFELGD
jgi:ribonuclease BN (tRNA processing enzyme)